MNYNQQLAIGQNWERTVRDFLESQLPDRWLVFIPSPSESARFHGVELTDTDFQERPSLYTRYQTDIIIQDLETGRYVKIEVKSRNIPLDRYPTIKIGDCDKYEKDTDYVIVVSQVDVEMRYVSVADTRSDWRINNYGEPHYEVPTSLFKPIDKLFKEITG